MMGWFKIFSIWYRITNESAEQICRWRPYTLLLFDLKWHVTLLWGFLLKISYMWFFSLFSGQYQHIAQVYWSTWYLVFHFRCHAALRWSDALLAKWASPEELPCNGTTLKPVGLVCIYTCIFTRRRKPFLSWDVFNQSHLCLFVSFLKCTALLQADIFINHKISRLVIFLIRHISRQMYELTMFISFKNGFFYFCRFRKLFVAFSSYTYANMLKRIECMWSYRIGEYMDYEVCFEYEYHR